MKCVLNKPLEYGIVYDVRAPNTAGTFRGNVLATLAVHRQTNRYYAKGLTRVKFPKIVCTFHFYIMNQGTETGNFLSFQKRGYCSLAHPIFYSIMMFQNQSLTIGHRASAVKPTKNLPKEPRAK